MRRGHEVAARLAVATAAVFALPASPAAAQVTPINATIQREDGHYIVTPSSEGLAVDLEEAVRLRRRPGITGTMVVHIPADDDQACEVVVVTGTARVVVDPSKISEETHPIVTREGSVDDAATAYLVDLTVPEAGLRC